MAEINQYFNDLQQKVITISNDIDSIQAIYGVTEDEAEVLVKKHSLNKDMAILGNKVARSHVISDYARVLRYLGLNDYADIENLIKFNEIQNNEVGLIFEFLLCVYDISELLDRHGLVEILTESKIREIADAEKGFIDDYFSTFANQIMFLAYLFYAREYGQDCIENLQHHNINEIGVLGKDYIYITYKGIKIYLQFLKFPSSTTVLNIQKKTTINSPYNYDEGNPSLITSKLNSSRISVAGYDMTPDADDLYYNERIFNLSKITLEEMRDRYHTIDQNIYDFLVLNQMGRGSYMVTGSDMGVGKSTFLLAMMEKVPQKWSLGILDTQNELQAHKKYPLKNILTLIENEKRSIAQCFEYMLKTSRDILAIGEISKPAEVAELINASLRLNAGVSGTFHSLSPEEVITNLRNLLMRTEIYNNAEVAETDLSKGLDLIINLIKLDGGWIVVSSIDEIQYIENDVWIDPVLSGSRKDKIDNILNMLQITLSKNLYQKKYRLNRLFEYRNNVWKPLNPPSQTYLNKIGLYIAPEELEALKEIFAYKGDY